MLRPSANSYLLPLARQLATSRLHSTTTSRFRDHAANMIVEQAKDSDYDAWELLFRGYHASYGSTFPDEHYPATWKRIMDPNGDVDALVIRDEPDGKAKGLAHLLYSGSTWTGVSDIAHLNGEAIAESSENFLLFGAFLTDLADLFVDSSTRGKGYGRKLMLAVKDFAKEKGCVRVRWVTRTNNEVARKLYDSLATTEFVEYRMPIN